MQRIIGGLALLIALAGRATVAAEFDSYIPMREKGATTYYVDGEIYGVGPVDFMVDTGSGYMTINEETLAILQQTGGATYVRELSGVLADGSTKNVPMYRIAQVRIGAACTLHDVEAAVFPGNTRQILGLNALRQAAPFIFSMNPPQLVLSHCTARVAQDGDGAS